MKSEHLFRKASHPRIFGRDCFGYINAYLNPVDLLLIPQSLHMLRIIRIIIDGDHRTCLVEVIHQHPLLIEIKYPHRTLDVLHASLSSPLFHRSKQGFRDIAVVNKLDKAEAHIPCLPFLVGMAVDDSGDATHNSALPIICHKRLHLREFKSRILFGIKRIAHIRFHIGHVIRTSLIKPFRKLDEIVHFMLGLNFLYSHIFHNASENTEHQDNLQICKTFETIL